jgi:hypothetical protein
MLPQSAQERAARRTKTIDETKPLFSRITDKRDKAILLIAYRHGPRASAVELLRVEDLGLSRLDETVPT